MLTHRKKLQTSSESKRKYKYILPLSKPKLVLNSRSFINLTSDIDHTFASLLSKNSFSIKALNTHRTFERPQLRLHNEQTKKDNHPLRVNNCKAEKFKFDIFLCIQNKEIPLSINANTVSQLTQEVKRYLQYNKLNNNIKTLQTVNQHLALDYLLSIPQMNLENLLYKNVKLRPYFGSSQTEVNIQNFEIIKAIGSGGFSTVFLVRFKADGKFYGMKAISKAFISKNKKQRLIINQKNVMTNSNHPFLAKLHWSFQSKNYLIFVMDYYPGGELFGVLKRFKRMSQGMAKFYITEILLGLEELHKLGIAYRDLKPENILLDKDGHACISDFGLVKPGLKSAGSRTFSFCGSPQYMPPQIVARKGHSLNADFYSLGALLFQLLTGLPPFYHRDPEQIYKGTLNGSLVLPAFLSDNVKDILLRLLSKSQDDRLGAKHGVEQILSHPWFGKVNRERFTKKKVVPPLSFINPQDLSFNQMEMKEKNVQFLKGILKEQLETDSFSYMLPDFRYSQIESNAQAKENFGLSSSKANSKPNLFTKKRSIKMPASSERLKKLDNYL